MKLNKTAVMMVVTMLVSVLQNLGYMPVAMQMSASAVPASCVQDMSDAGPQ